MRSNSQTDTIDHQALDDWIDTKIELKPDSLWPLSEVDGLPVLQGTVPQPPDTYELVVSFSARNLYDDTHGYVEIEDAALLSTSRNAIVMDQMVQVFSHMGSQWKGTLITAHFLHLPTGPYFFRVPFHGPGSSLWVTGGGLSKTHAVPTTLKGFGALSERVDLTQDGVDLELTFNLYCEGESPVSIRAIQLYRAN